MKQESTRHADGRCGLHHRWGVGAVLAFAVGGLNPTEGNAYTAAGDRNFPATLILPQVGPSDAFWSNVGTQPMATTRQTELDGTYSKLITERLGIQLEGGVTWNGSVTSAHPIDVLLQYEPIVDQPHEFVLSIQVDHNFGSSVTFPVSPATTPALTFAKGFGDLPIDYLRPLAITAYGGYHIAGGAHPNQVTTGLSVQYSIPYLLSKVAYIDLPPFLRGVTPLTEVVYNSAVGRTYGQNAELLIAPGISYSQGKGWELGIEAMIPATKAAGRGIGVIAQFVIQLDYLLPDSFFGRPIFPLNEPR